MVSVPVRLGLVAVLCTSVYFLLPNSNRPSYIPPATPGSDPNIVFERRIVALGDLHGDLSNALTVLRMSGVIDEDQKWTGNVDFLVQTGDIIDRGDDTIPLYELMDDLRAQAKEAGDQVLNHLGNHEYMNAIGDWRYVYNSEIKTFGSVTKRQRILSTGWLGKTWRANYTVTSRLPLHPLAGDVNSDYIPSSSSASSSGDTGFTHAALSFVHGGISPSYLDATPYPSRINELGSSLLKKLQIRQQPTPHPPGAYPGLPSSATIAEHELYDANGPLWYRGWALDDDEKVCGEINGVLEKIGVRRLVMGHTLNYDGIVSRCDSKILLIDTGMSPAYGGILSALDVRYTLTPLEVDRSSTSGGTLTASSTRYKRFVETETIHAIYPHVRQHIHTSTREVILDL